MSQLDTRFAFGIKLTASTTEEDCQTIHDRLSPPHSSGYAIKVAQHSFQPERASKECERQRAAGNEQGFVNSSGVRNVNDGGFVISVLNMVVGDRPV